MGNNPSGTVVYGALDDAYLRIRIQGRGADGDAFTADDELNPETTFRNADDTVFGEVTGPGADGVWFTADDRIGRETTYISLPKFPAFDSLGLGT